MTSRSALAVALGFGLFAAGYFAGHGAATVEAANPSAPRVFELRTYHTAPGKLDDLHARFRNHTMKIFARHGMTNIVYLNPLDPPLKGNALVYLLAYPNREAATTAWEKFRNDPEWKKVRAESEANGKIVEKVDSLFLEPTDYSPMK